MHLGPPAMYGVKINHQLPAGFQHTDQCFDRTFHIWCMLQYTETKYLVKTAWPEGHVVNARLEKMKPWIGAIVTKVCFYGIGIINAVQVGVCMIQYYLGK